VGSSISEIISLLKNSLGIEAKLKFLPPRAFDPPKIILNPQKVMDKFFWSPKISIKYGISKYRKKVLWFICSPKMYNPPSFGKILFAPVGSIRPEK
jgi:UDP-glucose 4-epimerase